MSKKNIKKPEELSGPYYSADEDLFEEEENEWGDYAQEFSKRNRYKSGDKNYAKKPRKIVKESDWN